ncbi:uridylate kinase [Catellatospora sp. NPDC049133]|jgi:uridine kinase|uniref:uridylate kinase n=1 Tax=Catellatospora sp. NPDC049133 TaxID=3155499 RepID=UPI0033E18A05
MSRMRAEVLAVLADSLLERREPGRLRVAIDGPDAAGKTTLADDLAALIGPRRQVIRLGIDRFHHPEAVRRRRGPLSPEGFYLDSFDHEAIVDGVLRPLGPDGDGWYRPAVFDYRSDRAVNVAPQEAAAGAVLLFDGVFLLRPELRDFWDISVYLHADPEVALARARVRDLPVFGSVEAVEERYRCRYLPGQELYRAEADPLRRADVVLDTNDPAAPVIMRWSR